LRRSATDLAVRALSEVAALALVTVVAAAYWLVNGLACGGDGGVPNYDEQSLHAYLVCNRGTGRASQAPTIVTVLYLLAPLLFFGLALVAAHRRKLRNQWVSAAVASLVLTFVLLAFMLG
jgi:hypothetical protein